MKEEQHDTHRGKCMQPVDTAKAANLPFLGFTAFSHEDDFTDMPWNRPNFQNTAEFVLSSKGQQCCASTMLHSWYD